SAGSFFEFWDDGGVGDGEISYGNLGNKGQKSTATDNKDENGRRFKKKHYSRTNRRSKKSSGGRNTASAHRQSNVQIQKTNSGNLDDNQKDTMRNAALRAGERKDGDSIFTIITKRYFKSAYGFLLAPSDRSRQGDDYSLPFD
ncbi:hypothetical protein OAB57_03725, partial [Bacteriovoracaceae bacterium]|nr:hypothetical protein [Bacteriovoracaceae bacterium]